MSSTEWLNTWICISVAKLNKSLTSIIMNFTEKTVNKGVGAFEKAAIDVATGVIEGTPIGIPDIEGGSRGNLKGNWQIKRSLNDRYFETVRKPDLGRSFAEKKIKGKFSKKKSSRLVMFNNTPYANVVEYGGYPSHVVFGTWYKKSKFYEKRSENKFSKQAPHGMVRINAQRFSKLFKRYYVSTS